MGGGAVRLLRPAVVGHAYKLAQAHAQVPRIAKGGRNITMDDLSDSSRGRNWNEMKSRGARSLGRGRVKAEHVFEHPDGHPDAGLPGIPKHHDAAHIHAVNSKGEELAFTW